MTKHPSDHRALPQGGRVKHFLKIAHHRREGWHRTESSGGSRRLVEFCRIARGRTT